ncbi:unnamed protein product [Notodromas monacha]|uniref:Rho-GAP domain-containing protein n=1 Tax=Notodromas monacha TaxID=399045 RepID=A0A7R9GGN2_9CRUS|nr:unnamed protein product [Notodromas monacha]CAG0922022.1 unnamed protein product [Notodromas monacha]
MRTILRNATFRDSYEDFSGVVEPWLRLLKYSKRVPEATGASGLFLSIQIFVAEVFHRVHVLLSNSSSNLMKKFSRRLSFPNLRSASSKKSLDIETFPQSTAENIYSGICMRTRSTEKSFLVNESPKSDRPVSLFDGALDGIKFSSPLTMTDDDCFVLEASEEVILPPPSSFADDASFSSSPDYEEIPNDEPLEPYLSTLPSYEDSDPNSFILPSVCGESSLLDEIEAEYRGREVRGAQSASVRVSILEEFDPLRSCSSPSKLPEPLYATVKPRREMACQSGAVHYAVPRDSVYSSYSDSSSSGFEDSVKDMLPRFEDTLGLGDGFQLAGFKLCTLPNVSKPPLEGYLFHFNEDKKDFSRLWCILKDGLFNPFAGPLPAKGKIGKKWCLETKFITTISSVTKGSLGVVEGKDLSFFEISSLYDASVQGKKPDRRIFGALLDSDSMLWVVSLLSGIAPRCLNILEERFSEFSIIGTVYYKENVSGIWRTGGLMLLGSELFLESLEDDQFWEMDLRKVRSVGLKSVEDSGNALGVYDKGTVFVLTMTKSTLYFQCVLLKDTKTWHSRLGAAWQTCGMGPELDRFFLTEDDVPIIVDKCIKFVSTHGVATEGIYRKSASSTRTTELLERLKKDPWGTILTVEEYNEHDVANALKRFFRTLPSPLLTSDFAELWIAFAGVPVEGKKLEGYENVLKQLPVVNRCTLKALMLHLHSIASQQEINSMPAKNLAPLWGPTLMTVEAMESEGGFARTSEQSDVICDLIANFSRLFDVSDDELQKEAKIISLLEKLREGAKAPRQSGDMRVWVFLYDAKMGSSVSITVTPSLTSGDLCAQFLREGKLKGRLSDFSVYEILFDGFLERPLHHSEKVLTAILQWTTWDEPFRANNTLVLKKNDLYPRIAHYQPRQPLNNLAALDFADRRMKSFKSYVFDFSNAILHCYKEEKDAQNKSNPLHEWKIENIIWYLGTESKRNAPHKWSVTFVEKDAVIKKTKDSKWFGYTLSFKSEEVRLRWLSSFLYSKHSDGLVPLAKPESDLLQ